MGPKYPYYGACHGATGEGNQGMGAPPLVGQSDWYLYKSIQKYKSSVRGSGKGDVFGPAMIGMVATLGHRRPGAIAAGMDGIAKKTKVRKKQLRQPKVKTRCRYLLRKVPTISMRSS